MKTIVFASKKGGVSKTTSALFTALYLSEKHKTLLIDLDSQNALTDFFFQDYQDITIVEGLKKDVAFEECIIKMSDNLSVIPSKLNLDELNFWTKTGKEYLLSDRLSLVKDQYDYCVIDTPPSLHIETVMGLVCADIIVIPARLEKMDTRAIDFTIKKIEEEIKPYYNKTLQNIYLLGTQDHYHNRTINDLAYESLIENYKDNVLPIRVPYSSKVSQFNYIGYSSEKTEIKEYRDLVEVVK